MQLIKYQESQSLRSINQSLSLFRASQDQFQHDIVSQQDVRRIRHDAVFFLVIFLTGVPFKGDWTFSIWKTVFKEFFQFAFLTVRQCIHGINNDCLNSLATPITQYVIDYWDDICEAFSRSSSCCKNIVLTFSGRSDGIFLMLV